MPRHAQTKVRHARLRGHRGVRPERSRKKKRKNKSVALWKSCVALTCRHRGECRAGRDERGAGDECESGHRGGRGRPSQKHICPLRNPPPRVGGRISLFLNRRISESVVKRMASTGGNPMKGVYRWKTGKLPLAETPYTPLLRVQAP